MRSVGVMGDERTYDHAVALRAVTTSDFMTAESAELPWEVIGKVTTRIVNEVKGVNRVLYDCRKASSDYRVRIRSSAKKVQYLCGFQTNLFKCWQRFGNRFSLFNE